MSLDFCLKKVNHSLNVKFKKTASSSIRYKFLSIYLFVFNQACFQVSY